MSDDDERLYTKADMSRAIQTRLKQAKADALNSDVVIAMLRSITERLEAIELEIKR